MTTNVPAPTFGSAGFIAPNQAAILAGVQSDQAAAFGASLNPALNTPQGQLASSQAANIGRAFDLFLALANGVDPAFASGRMQDAIARIYFLTRNPAQQTVTTATCRGLTGTLIPINARAVDQGGNLYLCTQAGVIPANGAIDLTFACQATGAVACPAGYLNAIYQAIPGWDSIANAAAGIQGNAVETRADFEYRRAQSVAVNASGCTAAVLGAVLSVAGVLDGYALENPYGYSSGASFTGSISLNTLIVTAMAAPTVPAQSAIVQGMAVSGPGVVPGTLISSFLSGSGGVGSYVVSIPQTTPSTAMTAAIGGVALLPHSIYIAAYGGSAAAIAAAILTKKNPGCDYNGNTTVSVQDTNPVYAAPFPSYAVTFNVPTPTPILFSISMQANGGIPANAIALIQAAVISAFTGADGGPRARIASPIFASRFYSGIAALGTWALIYSIQLGIAAANQNTVQVAANQIPTISIGAIAVSFT